MHIKAKGVLKRNELAIPPVEYRIHRDGKKIEVKYTNGSDGIKRK
jgi:hypothetical protein